MVTDVIHPYTLQARIPPGVCVRFLSPSRSHAPSSPRTLLPAVHRSSLRITLQGVGVEHLEFQPFFKGRRHPSGEAAKSSEQLITTNHRVRISNGKLPKQFLPKCENLANKMN